MPDHTRKRKYHSAHKGSGESRQPVQQSHNKRGRSELRKITRTARRDGVNQDSASETSATSVEHDDDSKEETSVAPETKPDMAYNALLTLLQTDHEEKVKRNGRSRAQDEIDDEIAGANFDEEEEAEESEQEGEDNDEDDLADPFHVHFNNVTEEYIEAQDKIKSEKWQIKSKNDFPDSSYKSVFQVPPGEPIATIDKSRSLDDLHIKRRVLNQFAPDSEELSDIEQDLLKSMLQYRDINFSYSNHKNTAYKKIYAMHAVNHIFKTRDTILKNNYKLSTYQENLKQGKTNLEEPELRDQGFTRPKVLILLPTRDACYEIINTLIQYSGADQVENKKRFKTQFFEDATPPENKPEDFKHYFKGNTNDFFTMGLKFTRKSVKLYSSFYSSDILVASPIGLTMILENPDKKKRQSDFLSSIEVCIVDYANQIEMQNWDHISTIYKYLNKIPKEFHDADFSRIRMWSINDHAKLLTQNIVFSEYSTPFTNSIVNKSHNMSGKVKYKKLIGLNDCIMNSVGLKVKQIFQRFESSSPIQDPDARFKFFTNSVLTSLSNSASYNDGMLVIVPSYFDFIRVKNHLGSSKISFDSIDEYTSQPKLTRARQQFMSGKTKLLLYSERLHHFRRLEIGGVKNIILYGVPSNPLFYKEYLKFIGKSVFNESVDLDLAFMKIVFSKWDAVALERIVGSQRASVLCNSANEMYEFK